MATYKLRRGESQSFNYWLRARVGAQGLTIVALVAGTYYLRPKQDMTADADAERRRVEKAAREKEEFEERLRGAEDAYAVEKELMRGRKGLSASASAPAPASAGAGTSEETASRPSGRSWLGWLVGKGSSADSGTSSDKKL